MGDKDNFYDKFCKDRFDRQERRLDGVVNAVNTLITKVENGLSTRVRRIDRLMWVLIGAIIVEAIARRIFG